MENGQEDGSWMENGQERRTWIDMDINTVGHGWMRHKIQIFCLFVCYLKLTVMLID